MGHAVEPAADPDARLEIGPPTLVPSMQNRRIVSVASGFYHSLALSVEGEVYSWGNSQFGALGHGDIAERTVPSMIESLSRIKSIAVGPYWTSAAVDEDGRLFTWGGASINHTEEDSNGELKLFQGPSGLGYKPNAATENQLTPKRVAALSQDRVVGVALGDGFTLAVTDAGAVFSFGSSRVGVLGHGSLDSQVLPRRIEALVKTGWRFVAVAAGYFHALALSEEGELYGWGEKCTNGHGQEERTPQRVAALIGQHVKFMHAQCTSACAVTEKGELFTWGQFNGWKNLGQEGSSRVTPMRVAGLSGVVVVAVAIGSTHTLAADVDGVVWAFGRRLALGLDASNIRDTATVQTPIPIPTLCVRVLNSP